MPKTKDWRHSATYKSIVLEKSIDEAEAWYQAKTNKIRICKETEKSFQKRVMAYLEPLCLHVWENHTTGLISTNRVTSNPNKGMPDIMGVLKDGTFFCIELKRPSKTGWPPPATYDDKGLPSGEYAHYVSQRRWATALTSEHTIVLFGVTSLDTIKDALERRRSA